MGEVAFLVRRLSVLWVLFLLAPVPSFGVVLIYTDFDDTLVETREKLGGTFNTPFRIFRIDSRGTTVQPELQGPPSVDISPIDYQRIKKYLGEFPSRPGAINRKVRLEDGTQIIPGEYCLRGADSFFYFRTSPADRNYILENFVTAEHRSPEGKWKGPFWKYFAQILEHRFLADRVSILTARGHVQREWDQLLNHWVEQKHIRYAPPSKFFHSVALPKYEKYGRHGNVSQQKAGVLEEAAVALVRVPLRETDVRLNADGTAHEKTHYILFADDNQETLDLVVKKFQSLAQRALVPVKFGVFNMGYQSEVIHSGRPRFAIIRSDGTFRPATESEKIGEPESFNSLTCSETLEVAGKES